MGDGVKHALATFFGYLIKRCIMLSYATFVSYRPNVIIKVIISQVISSRFLFVFYFKKPSYPVGSICSLCWQWPAG